MSGSYYSTITGMLAGSNPCNCGTPVFAIVTDTTHGTLTLGGTGGGGFSYMPDPGYTGSDSFTFTFGNGTATSPPATETITINASALGAYTAPANIGANLDSVNYYSSAEPYVDMIRMASGWASTSSDTVHGAGQNLAEIGELDANGWPEEDAEIMLGCCGMPDGSAADPGPASMLVGKYQLSFHGIAVIGDDGGTVEDQQYDAATNTTTATLDQTPVNSQGDVDILLTFMKTQRTASSAVNTGITNVHLIRPQFAPNGAKWWDSPTQEFTDPFLASLAPFSTLRFMDWTMTNGNQQADWDEATPANWPTAVHMIDTNGVYQWNSADQAMEPVDNIWTNTGESWQSVIDLANATGKDIWINIPVRATDAYVTSLATLLKQGLNPGIHVYVEYANEVWNGGFEQWYYNDAQTSALLANNPTAAAAYQANCISWANDICHEAERAMQISNDFAKVWGGPAIGAAIRPVLCHQLVGPGSIQIALAFIQASYGPPAKYFYGICSAPYWGPSLTAGESASDFLAADAASIPQWDGYLLAYTSLARYYGLHNFTYEGGPGTTDLESVDTANWLAANATPQMGTDVTQAVSGAFENGADLYMYFNATSAWSKYGAWGATDDVLDLTQPKWQALQALAGKPLNRTLAVTQGNPSAGVPYPGTVLPGTIDAGQPVFAIVAGYPWPISRAAVSCDATVNGLPDVCTLFTGRTPGNGELAYLVTVPQAGTYTVTLEIDDRQSTQTSSAQFYVNQQPQGGVITIPASPAGTPSMPASFSAVFPAGVSLVELAVTGGAGFSIDSIVVSQ